jgi:hypothetical protein
MPDVPNKVPQAISQMKEERKNPQQKQAFECLRLHQLHHRRIAGRVTVQGIQPIRKHGQGN